MRLWCGSCGKSCGRVERNSDGDWIYAGAWRLSPAVYHGDPSMPWHKRQREANLSGDGVLHLRIMCLRGHSIVTDSDTMAAAARQGLENMTFPKSATLPLVAPSDE